MTKSETREKLLELAEWHDAGVKQHTYIAEVKEWHLQQAALLRQVAETMKDGWVSVEAYRLLAVRDQLLKEDESEAYHQLYMAAHENADNKFQPWNEWEAATLAARPKEKE